MKKIEIRCDFCDKDLTTTDNCIAYRLALINERIPSYSDSGVVTSMALYPHLKHDCYFCRWGCLTKWIIKEEGLISFEKQS